ncbi:hypothetical protein K4F52_004893 [Lecanicillium sp. MT-2017a]|nr:hypothetical protein K4F52_004893 [Lecanicillium sp. MT-2017a]
MEAAAAIVDPQPNPKATAQHVENISSAPRNVESDIETVALVADAPKSDFKLTPIILDQVRPDEVLIDMKYTGIFLQQRLLPMVNFPAIFGHEGAGTILALGSSVKNTFLKVGDAVLLSFNTCGPCNACTTGHPAFCHRHPEVNHNAVRITDRSTPARLQDGKAVRSQYFGQSSFAKMSVVNEKCVMKCPDAYEDQMYIYCAMGCGFQTGAGTVLNVLKLSKQSLSP